MTQLAISELQKNDGLKGADLLVSVILPTYNRAELLPRAINSVLAQTYPCWELIVWDDGSTDNTEPIVRSYNDKRIRYFSEKNHGVAYARNRAIEVSQGGYLAFLDSDDEWFENKLAAQVEALNTHPQIDMLFSDFMDIIESTQEKYRIFEQYSNVLKLLDVEQVNDGLFVIRAGMPERLAVENFIATDTVMIRRKLFDDVGGFAEELKILEDFELWWRMGLSGVCFAYLNRVYLTRFKPPGSLSSPGILTCENTIKGLDFCLQETLAKGRNDLVFYLNTSYRNAFQNLISLYGSIGNEKGMLNAFFQSMKYGFNLGSIRLLVEVIFGHKTHKISRK